MPDLARLLCALGHIADTQTLLRAGVGRGRLQQAAATGVAWRPRRGTYACPHLDRDLAYAAHVGGALTCATVLDRLGVWSGFGARVHLQVPTTHGRMPPLTDPHGYLPRVHWHEPRFGMTSRWRAGPKQALWQAMHCLDTENAVAAMESAVHEGVLSEREVRALAADAPRRLSRDIRDLEFQSGSGNESIVRVRLRRHGFRVEVQAPVPGLGHQDLLVEDVLGLEVDSRKFHDTPDQFELDRDRDLHAAGLGRWTLRVRPAHITQTWEVTLAVIERLVADGLRERRRRGVR